MNRLRDRLFCLQANGEATSICRAINISPKTLNKWLNDRQFPSPANMHKLHVRYPMIFVNENPAYWQEEVKTSLGVTNRAFHNRLKAILVTTSSKSLAIRCGIFERAIEVWQNTKAMPPYETLPKMEVQFPSELRGDMYEPELAVAAETKESGEELRKRISTLKDSIKSKLKDATKADMRKLEQDICTQEEPEEEEMAEEKTEDKPEQAGPEKWVSLPEKLLVAIANMVQDETDRWEFMTLAIQAGVSSKALALIAEAFAKNG